MISDSSANTNVQQQKSSKRVEIRTNHQPQIKHIEEFLNHDEKGTDSLNKKRFHHFVPILTLTPHLFVSFLLSSIIILSASYWEYSARSMDGFHHKWAHFTVCLGFATINLLPSISVSMKMYHSIISIAVIVYSVWFIFHIFGAWIHDICSYSPWTQMCVTVTMYKNISLSLLGGVVFHQWLLMFAHFRSKHTKKKIDRAFDKAENLEITEIDYNESKNDEHDHGFEIVEPCFEEEPVAYLNEEEFDKMYQRYCDYSGNHHDDGCKFCCWTHDELEEKKDEIADDVVDGKLEIVIMDEFKEMMQKYENLTVGIPRSTTNVHAIPVWFEE